jgi:hypothetical protein
MIPPETCAIPDVMIVINSLRVAPARNGRIVSGASVCPMKIDAATFVDSAPDVPIVHCINQATTLMICCINPMWYSTAKNALTKIMVGSTANANTLSGLLGTPRYPNTSPDPSAECPSSPVITPETLLRIVCP